MLRKVLEESVLVLAEVAKGKNNNISILKFIAAVMVIICHAYPLTLGDGKVDPLGRFASASNGLTMGGAAVTVFFFFGGYLIAGSVENKKTARKYFWARCIRIFPPLIAVTALLAFVVGPIVSSLTPGAYFSSAQTYKYMLNGILILTHDLPGVFEKSIYNSTVNGPLWTLPIEFACYVGCFVLYKLGVLSNKKGMMNICVILAALAIVAGNVILPVWYIAILRCPMMFFLGMAYYCYRDKIKLHWGIFAICAIGLILSIPFSVFNYTCYIFMPYVYAYLGFGVKYKFPGFSKYGDVSYGMYLCGWPIQQILCQIYDYKIGPEKNFVLAILLAIVCGYVLYYLVERPISVLQKKRRKTV